MVAVALLACAIVLAAVTGTSVMIPTLVGSAIGASLVLLLISRDKALEKPEPQVTAPAPEPTASGDAPATEAAQDSAAASTDVAAAEEPPAHATSDEQAELEQTVEPAPEPVTAPEPAPKPTRVGLDMDMLARLLFLSNEPIEVLRLATRDIKTRKTNSSLAPICGIPMRPTGAELYFMRMLTEAGIFDEQLDDVKAKVVRLTTSGLFYIRVLDERLPYPALVSLLRIESALNALQMAADGTTSLSDLSLEDVYVLFQRIVGSIEAEPLPASDEDGDGEWSCRHHISRVLESMRLPFRLHAEYRVNLGQGRVAFETTITSPEQFPSSAAVPGIGIVPATSDMRAMAARDYNLRVAHLLAELAFASSPQVESVWVAGVHDTPASHECLYSVCFDRERFELLDLAEGIDPVESALSFGATISIDGTGLAPVDQGFSLADESFCPRSRYEAPERSSRLLADDAARALGTRRVCGLSVDESDRRSELAELIMRGIGSSTSENVSLIMSLVEDDPDPTVHMAAERTVAKLIAGTLDEDPLVVADEFLDGDALSRAVVRARDLMAEGDPVEAERVLSRALAPIEACGTYDDSPTVRYRFFADYPERVLYNRMLAADGVTTLLVPEAYAWAHVLRSVCLLMQGRTQEALAGARRGVELCPLSSHARLHLAQCLEANGDTDGAIQALSDLLDIAHDGFGVGFAYYRMAFILWQRGDSSGAQACYKRAVRFAPVTIIPIAEGADPKDIPNPADLRSMVIDKRDDKVLTARSIPLAPTRRVREACAEAARAALDAEVFPVARSLIQSFVELDRDDVTFGVLRSIEGEPDR